MSSISSVGSGGSWAMQGMQGMHKGRHASASEIADQAFSTLDSSGKGYIDKADLQKLSTSASSTGSVGQGSDSASGVDKLFSALDADGSGQVSKQEFTDTLQKIADALDQQRHSSKMENAIAQAGLGGRQGAGGPQGMPPPPPGGGGPKGDGDGGMTKEQMSSKLSETGGSDSQLSSLLSNTLQNFEAADSNQDGKVSAEEAMAYQKAHESPSSAQTGGTATAANSSGLSSAQVLMQVSRLFDAYIANNSASGSASSLSVSA